MSEEMERPALELKERLRTIPVGAWLESHFRKAKKEIIRSRVEVNEIKNRKITEKKRNPKLVL